MLYDIAINFKSCLDLNEKDSPPCPSKTKLSQHVFQANRDCHISSCWQYFQTKTSKSKEQGEGEE